MLKAIPSLDDLVLAGSPVVEQKVAEAQAQANELAAAVLSAHPGRHGTSLAAALRFFNWAVGFDFDGSQPPAYPARLAKIAVALVRIARRDTRRGRRDGRGGGIRARGGRPR